MRRSLFWSLCAALALSGAALWWPQQPASSVVGAVAVAVDGGPRAVADEGAAAAAVERDAPAAAIVAPPPPAPLEKARFDPFAGLQPPPAQAPAAAPGPKPFVGPIYVPPPSPPALNYRYLGQIVDPSGQRVVYLAGPAGEVLAAVGTRLDEGYVVEAINADGVRLHYPPLDARAVIPLPTSGDAVALAPRSMRQ